MYDLCFLELQISFVQLAAVLLVIAIGGIMIRILKAPTAECEKVALDVVQAFRRDHLDRDAGVENMMVFDLKIGNIFRSKVYQANIWWTKNRSISVQIIDPANP